jgi:crotonobetainyl-CoA:carnitine CoA-transferase CaiB-like acyl-CoA transferase
MPASTFAVTGKFPTGATTLVLSASGDDTAAVALPLDGVRVLELSTGLAAGFAGRLLRGYGADVRRADLPAAIAPVDLTADEATYVHTGKGAATIEAIHASAVDIVVSDLQPAALAAVGIDWSAVHSEHPDLVVVSVTPFGLTGPYADYAATNAVMFAMGGIMSLTGDAARTPLVTGGSQGSMNAGLNAFGAAVTAWCGRQRHGNGDIVDISAQECAAGMLEWYGPNTAYGGPVISRLGNHTRATWALYPCKDGWAGVFALNRQTPPLFALLDDPELSEERFVDVVSRVSDTVNDELTVKMYLYFTDKTKEEILGLSLMSKVPMGVATTPAELLDAPGLVERGVFESIGSVTVPGRPFPGLGWRPSETPASIAPWPSRAQQPVSAADRPITPPARPLDGVRVIDLTMMWAGPFASLRLAEMGADVIKVESPSAWDNIRTLIPQPGAPEPWNTAFYFNAYSLDKRSLTLDLAQPAGRELLLRLATNADVLIENYRSDVLDKLGIGYETLKRANPRLVVVSMAAFGKEGPDRDYVGYGPVIELMSGLVSLTGYGDGEPFKTGISYGDPMAGTAAASAAVLGLLDRERTGHGCHVDLAQRETSVVLIGEAFVAASRGELPVHRGCRNARFAPQGCYRTALVEQWLVVSVRTDDEWAALCGTIGRRDLAGLTAPERHARHDELDEAIEGWSTTQDPQDAFERLQAAGVPAGRVLDTGTVLDDIHLIRRGFWEYVPHPMMHRYKQQGSPWRFQHARPVHRHHAPLFGEHNREILTGLLGLTDDELAALAASNVIADAPINPGVG